jgi:ParB family chromosome partitioning protein
MQLMVYEQILEYEFSVRKTEEIVKALNEGESTEIPVTPAKPKKKTPEEYDLLKKHLSSFLSAKVSISCNDKGAGKISIAFANEKELETILQAFDAMKNK